MNGLISIILLQTRIQFWPEQSTTSIIVGISLIAGFFLILLFGTLIAGRRRRRSPEARQKYSRFVFQRMAANVGLSKEQVDALEHLVIVCKVKQPFLIFSNVGLLDDTLKKGIYSLANNKELSEEKREKQLSDLFKIKESIEQNYKRGVGITSTNLIRPGQQIVLTFPDGQQIQTKIATNLKRMLVCAIPESLASNRLAWKRGTNIKAHFWRSNDSGYALNTKILGYDQMKGQPTVMIQHSKTLKRSQQRKFRRRLLARSCFFYPIEVMTVGKGRKAARKAFVQRNFKHLGNFLDISAGGCSINSQAPLERGKLLMIEFEIERGSRITAFGKVRRLTGHKTQLSIMHIMFTKVTSNHLNSIYSYVYNYVPPQTASSRNYRLAGSKTR